VKITFRTRISAIIVCLTLAAMGGSTLFLLNLYSKDRYSAILQQELSNTIQAAHHLDNLISLSDVIATDKVHAAHEILFMFDHFCDDARAAATTPTNLSGTPSAPTSAALTPATPIENRYFESDLYRVVFRELSLTPDSWLKDPDIKNKVCSSSEPILILPNPLQLMLPYMFVAIRHSGNVRLVGISMDGYKVFGSATLFLTNARGKILWSSDGDKYVRKALADTGVSAGDIANMATQSTEAKITEKSTDGIISYAPVRGDWAFMSLVYKPAVLRPITFAVRQSGYLLAGFFFLCVFVGRLFARLLSRPLNQLRESAQKIGAGDFAVRFDPKTIPDEIGIVKLAFNSMADQIVKLLEETKMGAELESELKLANEVQKMLLPPATLEGPGYKISSFTSTASQCGGDWWGVIEIPRENGQPPLVLALIGDVTGHGTHSALITAVVKGSAAMLEQRLRENPEFAQSPQNIISSLNKIVFEITKGSISMTFFVAVIDPEKHQLTCCNAGHNLPYLLDPPVQGSPGKIQAIGKGGVALGSEKDGGGGSTQVFDIQNKTKLFLYTDGLIDCIKDEQNLFDRKHLRKSLLDSSMLRGKELMRKVLSERSKKIGGLKEVDDVTAVLIDFDWGAKP